MDCCWMLKSVVLLPPTTNNGNNSVLGIPEPELRVGVIHDEWRFDDSTERR